MDNREPNIIFSPNTYYFTFNINNAYKDDIPSFVFPKEQEKSVNKDINPNTKSSCVKNDKDYLEERKKIKQIRNKISAKKSRDKKNFIISQLTTEKEFYIQRVFDLESEVKRLKNLLISQKTDFYN